MKYDIKTIIDRYNRKEQLKFIFFWGHTENSDEITKACFSQWYPCEFIVDKVLYFTTEQYMMAQKALLFGDNEVYDEILKATHPKQFKELGRAIKNFKDDIWNDNKYKIVLDGNVAKFSQNNDLKQFILKTNTRILVETSPNDRIWGIGINNNADNIENPLTWKGDNLLGFALMEVRDLILN